MRKTVAVGVDASAESLNAARYAAAMAQRRRASLTLVHGFLFPLGYGALGLAAFAPVLPTDPRADAWSLLDTAAAALRDDYPGVEIHTVETASSGQLALIDQSRTADVTVVGHRGLGGFPELMLGSVSAQVVAHVYSESVAGSAAAAEALLDTVLGRWAAKHPEVTIRRRTRSVPDLDDTALRRHAGLADNAEAVFVDASRHASLVVVGSRGRGGFTGLLLGSVGQALTHYAHSPVAVIHTDTTNR